MVAGVFARENVQVYLPVCKGYQEQWENLGVEWLTPFAADAILTKARLPLGWSIKDLTEDVGKHFYVLDAIENIQAEVKIIKVASKVQAAVKFFNEKPLSKKLVYYQIEFEDWINRHHFIGTIFQNLLYWLNRNEIQLSPEEFIQLVNKINIDNRSYKKISCEERIDLTPCQFRCDLKIFSKYPEQLNIKTQQIARNFFGFLKH